ncbi:IS200/IS605 family accessory protein TnpB-related protein [Peribacillus sp. NPDC006672]|uniref:IS200/IS605 family accessory protein TnpB-related protein n=1 Tax=Peribacillus sp. NPDC006672 TaxID=3390606 RepID=UPI003D06861E
MKEERFGRSRREKSMQLTLKEKFKMNDYYTNSVVQESKAILSSQKELKKLYVSNKEEQIKSVKKKMKSLKNRLTTLTKIKESFIKGKPAFNKTSREQKMGRYFVLPFKKKTDIYYHAYQFEHEYLDVEIRNLQSKLGRLNFRLDRLEKLLRSLKNNVKNVVFGSKKRFNQQFTLEKYVKNPESWKSDWHQSRYNKMTVSGRKDAKYGNFVFTYNSDSTFLSYQTPNGVCVEMPVVFPYGQENVDFAVKTQLNCKNKKQFGKPVAWSLEDHGDYYIVKCLIDMDGNPNKNYSKAEGVFGVDLNVDHIAWSHVNSKGQLVKSGVLEFDIEGKTSGQITKIIEAEAIQLVELAARYHKPIALEKLNTTKSKASNPYGNKKANRKMSMFAYNQLISAIKNRAEKMGVTVFDVNPAFTSQIGKIKYMKRLGISIHQAASFVIARRAMGFKEKLPPVLHSLLPEKMVGLHHWAQWKWISSSLSGFANLRSTKWSF